MATLSASKTSLLTAVVAVGNAATASVTAVANVALMASAWSDSALNEQRTLYAIESLTASEVAMTKAAQRAAEHDLETERFCATSADHRKFFEAHLSRIRAAMTAKP